MKKELQFDSNVSLCYENKCIHATGDNANLIAFGAFVMLILIGVVAITKSN